jgi:hypothetical protein
VIHAGEVIEHLFDPEHLFSEASRVINATGKIVLTTPNLASVYSRIAFIFGYYPYAISPSARRQAGKVFGGTKEVSPSNEQGFTINNWYENSDGRGTGLSHIRGQTKRSIKEMADIHGLEMTVCSGIPIQKRAFDFRDKILFPIKYLDKIISNFSSLAIRILVVLQPD